MRKPIKPINRRSTTATSVMAEKGLDKRNLPQLLSLKSAIKLVNYEIITTGRLVKRKGLEELNDVGGGEGTMLKRWSDRFLVSGADGTVTVYDTIAKTSSTIKNTFTGDSFDGASYGDYFFVVDGEEDVNRISIKITVGSTTGFSTGQLIEGASSGMKAVVMEVGGSELIIGNLRGADNFISGEQITSKTGSTTVIGQIRHKIEVISNSGVYGGISAIGARLYAFNRQEDSASLQYTKTDSGANPPFPSSDWTVGTNFDDGDLVNWRSAGTIRAVAPLGQYAVVFADDGKFAFEIQQSPVGTDIKKINKFIQQKLDLGGGRGAINTIEGMFYVNEAGVWQMIALGQTDIPYSGQEIKISSVLGTEYFKDVDFTNASLAYSAEKRMLYITIAQDSETNNLVIAYNLELGAFPEISGWNVGRFATLSNDIYAISSTNGKLYKCFSGYSDNGAPIGTSIAQEITLGTPDSRKFLKGFYSQGRLSPSTELEIKFSIYNRVGKKESNKLIYKWTVSAEEAPDSEEGWGESGVGNSGFGVTQGGDTNSDGLIESFNGCRPFIRNFQRLIVEITGGDRLPHELNWFKVDAMAKANIRRRNLNKIS